VRLVGELQRIRDASSNLQKIIEMREIRRDTYYYKVPVQNTWGPEITKKVLSLFKKIPEEIFEEREEIGVIPEPALEDVAGLDEIKNFVHQRIIAPFEDEERAYKLGLRIGGGILLFGPPGTGKTLIASAIAKSIQAKFIEITPSVIIGYPGEAEKRIENIFVGLEKEPRAVVFIDEAEWILCKREDQNSSVMQRITPVLLAQLSRIFKEKTRPIIIVAATNKPEMIDPAFLRPGRFDKIFFVNLPDESARVEIIKLQLKNRVHNLTENDLQEIANKLDGYSGADIEGIIENAAFMAFERKNNKIMKEDLLSVITHTLPSVAQDEIQKMIDWAKQRGLKV
jgi:transitional endoplasmic reticulum ATPase